jgi:hypothetical protein
MAKFFVGQRVRLVRPVHQENLGLTGRIIDLFPNRHTRPRSDGLEYNCDVSWGRQPSAGHACDTAQLEPILDRHEPCESEFKESLDALLTKEAASDKVV